MRIPKSLLNSLAFLVPLLELSLASQTFAESTPSLINYSIDVKNKTIGRISVSVNVGDSPSIFGTFIVEESIAKNLSALSKYLSYDHLNWFQYVESIVPEPPNIKTPLIDPPKGGFGAGWNDDRPWYIAEEPPPDPLPDGKKAPPTFIPAPPAKTALDEYGKSSGPILFYEDTPQGRNSVARFYDFLVSDFGNKTYDVLGKGFAWTIEFQNEGSGRVTALENNKVFLDEYAQKIKDVFEWTRANHPNSTESTQLEPEWYVRKVGSPDSLILNQPFSNGSNITNLNSSIVQYSKVIESKSNTTNFIMPGRINNKSITSASIFTKIKNDPGTLYFSAFDDFGLLTSGSLPAWLLSHDYLTKEVLMPDFLPMESEPMIDDTVFYGVNWEELGDNGQEFANKFVFGEVFTIDSHGHLVDSGGNIQLPMYQFSATPLSYAPGLGWVGGTNLPPGYQLRFNGYTSVGVPTPLSYTFVAGLFKLSRSLRARIAASR